MTVGSRDYQNFIMFCYSMKLSTNIVPFNLSCIFSVLPVVSSLLYLVECFVVHLVMPSVIKVGSTTVYQVP